MNNEKTGLLIAKQRKLKKLTQTDLADKLGVSTNANEKNYSMDNLPEYEITLGSLATKYDTLTFTVEKGKTNKYLNEFLKMINVDLSKCAKPEYR